MSDYTRVLKGLRHCINLDGLEPNDTRIRCHGCPYFTEPTRCGGILMRDAAAAIESLQAEVERLKDSNEELREKQTFIDHYGNKWMTSAKDVPTAAYEHGCADGRDEAMAKMEVQE